MALSMGFKNISFPPSCHSSYGVLDSYPGGTLTHCSCQPSLDAHFWGVIWRPAHPLLEWATILVIRKQCAGTVRLSYRETRLGSLARGCNCASAHIESLQDAYR